jgi:hypothetical protein
MRREQNRFPAAIPFQPRDEMRFAWLRSRDDINFKTQRRELGFEKLGQFRLVTRRITRVYANNIRKQLSDFGNSGFASVRDCEKERRERMQ